jgi:hypothetical protein
MSLKGCWSWLEVNGISTSYWLAILNEQSSVVVYCSSGIYDGRW